jgi:hypothetical protein
MKKALRVRLISAAVIVAGATGLLWPREPSYGGKRLSAWLKDFEAEQAEKRMAAADAVRHIGSNAVPLVIEKLRMPGRSVSHPSRVQRWKEAFATYLRNHTSINVADARASRPRLQAFAALDALGPAGKDALPALEQLLQESPPDPDVLYIVARMGEAGNPVLRRAGTNEEKLIRWEAAICLNMPEHLNAPSAGADLNRRLCEFHLRIMRASFQEYVRLHPEAATPKDASPGVPTFIPKLGNVGETNAVRRPVAVNPLE